MDRFATFPGEDTLIHDLAAIRAKAHRNVSAPVIEVGTIATLRHSLILLETRLWRRFVTLSRDPTPCAAQTQPRQLFIMTFCHSWAFTRKPFDCYYLLDPPSSHPGERTMDEYNQEELHARKKSFVGELAGYFQSYMSETGKQSL